MKKVTADVTLTIMDKPMKINISVPNKKTKPSVLLPFMREITQITEDLMVEQVVANGNRISCSKGCGACCNQLVPITQLEARYIVSLIDRMPQKKKQKYKERFFKTYQQLEQAGIMDQLMDPRIIGEDYAAFGIDYFRLGIPCPFLEEGSCSIHPERPLRCREYLVTSPAINCSNPSEENIKRVEYPVRMSNFLARTFQPWTKYPQAWVPLSIIFKWVERHPEVPSLRHSTEWIDDALKALSTQSTDS